MLTRRLYLPAAVLLATMALQTPAAATQLTSEDWRKDLAFVLKTLEEVHPNLYARVSESELRTQAAALERDLPTLENHQIVARLVELVARIEDGHTGIEPVGENGFQGWFPIRLYDFEDGLHVLVAQSDQEDLIGAKVLRVGNLSAKAALERVMRLAASDNLLGKRSNAGIFLSNADALHALGVIESKDKLNIEVQTPSGETRSAEISRIPGEYSISWFWRANGGPPGGEYVTAFAPENTPLYLRHQTPSTEIYWFEYLEDSKTLFCQVSGFWDREAESFADFNHRMWDVVDQERPERFVLDLRYHGGGDGGMVNLIVHEFIKRDWLNQEGRVFVVSGRRTFSSAVMAVGAMREHTPAIFVGEPMAAGLNHFGDSQSFTLPMSGLSLDVSSLYWQVGHPADKNRVFSPHVPEVPRSSDYFAGRDPALAAIVAGRAHTVPQLFRTAGADAALAAYERTRENNPGLDWWEPFTWNEINDVGYEFLAAHRLAEARAAFALNTRVFPGMWEVWDGLGEAYLESGQLDKARKHYLRSLEINPGNYNATEMLERIEAEE